jgi:MFS transporter, DHA1 family, inner membrane transport protein
MAGGVGAGAGSAGSAITRRWGAIIVDTKRKQVAELGVIFLARTSVSLPVRVTYPFLPAISRGLGVSLAAASTLVSVRSLTGVGAPLFGALVDWLGERRVMLLGLILLVAGGLLTAGLPGYGVALLGFGLLGLAKSAYDPAMQAYIGRQVPYERRGRALGIVELSWSATWLSMPLSGWLIENVNWRMPFFIFAALGVLVWWLIRRVIPVTSGRKAEAEGEGARLASLTAGLDIWRDRQAWLALSVTGLLMLAQDNLIVVYGAWMEDTFGLTVTALGLVSLLIGLAETTAELGAAFFSDRIGKRRGVFLGLVFAALGYLILPRLTGGLGLALLGLMMVILAFEFSVVCLIPLVSGLSATSRGTLMSFNVAAFSAGRMFAAPLAVALYRPGDLTRNGLLSALICVGLMGLLSFVDERGH